MNFQMFREGKKGPFRFQLLDDQSQLLMESISFPDRDTTINAMRLAVRQLRNENLDPTSLDNGYGWLLRNDEGNELMRSQVFDSASQADQALESLQQAAQDKQVFDVSMTVKQSAPAFRKLTTEVDFASFYDFNYVSPQGTAGFETFNREGKPDPYYFHFNDKSGQSILYSRGFDSQSKCTKRIRTVLKNVDKPSRYQRLETENGVYFILKASNGTEIARSRIYSNQAEREQAILSLQQQAPTYKASFPAPSKTKRKETYRLDVASQTGLAGFESFQHKTDRRHYFHLNDPDGNALVFSQAYLSKKSRNNGMRALAQNGNQATRLDPQENESGYYFLVRGGNRQAVARTKYFASAAERDNWMIWFQENIRQYATAFGINLVPASSTEVFSLEVEKTGNSASVGTLTTAATALGGLGAISSNGASTTVEAPIIETPIVADREVLEESKDDILTAEDGDEISPWLSNDPDPVLLDNTAKRRSWWPWLLLGLLALVLLFFLFKACGDSNVNIPPSADVEIGNTGADPEIAAIPLDSDEKETFDSSQALETDGNIALNEESEGGDIKTPQALGPDGAALGFRKGSMLFSLANFLSEPSSKLPKLFKLDNINFGFNSAHMNTGAYGEVDGLAKLMKAYPAVEIGIYGHIDDTESDDYDGRYADEITSLSGIRARCLYKKLNQRGISFDRMTFKGFASTKPLGAANKQNRRIEIVITER
ncbi:MAG: DUF1508 domain-containing protein [Bacteroidia bacterium]